MFSKALNTILLVVLFFAIVQEMKGQTPEDQWRKITGYQDLEIGEVYTITTDTTNLLWVGTSTGLYTYDGFYFEKVLDFAVNIIKFNHTNKHLWIGTKFDLFLLDTNSGDLQKMRLEKKLVSSVEFFFSSIYEDKQHKIWATSFNGLYSCEGDSCKNFLVEENPTIAQNDPYLNRFTEVVGHDHPDSLYIAALKGVYLFDLEKEAFTLTSHSSEIISNIINQPDHLILSNYSDKIEILRKDQDNRIVIDLADHERINKVIEGEGNKLWICTASGLHAWNDTLASYSNLAEPLYFSKPPKCYTIYEDSFGHLWAGFENGLYQWDYLSTIITAELASNIIPGQNQDLFEINEIADQELLITSSSDHIYNYNPRNKSIEKYFDKVEELIVISDELWILFRNQEVIIYDPISKSSSVILTTDAFNEADLPSYLSHTYDPLSNTLLIGRQWGRGISTINLLTGDFKRYDQVDFFRDHQFATTGFSYLEIGEANTIYFSFGKGLGRLNLQSGEAILVENGSQSACTGLDTDQKGNIYAVFEKDGLYKVTPELSKVRLEINDLETIYFDKDNDLWATSPNGIIEIDLDRNSCHILNKTYGLPKNNLYGAIISGGKSGRIYTQTIDWITYFDKEDLMSLDAYHVKPFVTQLPNQSFRFSSRNFKPEGLTQYEYQLKGFSNEWEKANQLNEVRFINLEGGKYKFQVRSSFAGNPWLYSDITDFKIPLPWWKRWYSIILGLLLLSGIVYFYNQQVRKQEQLKLQLKTIEMQTLRSQMNPHFIFNALNSIKHFILGNDKFLAAEYLSNFSMLIRKILHNSKSELISLSEEIETVKLYIEMEKIRFANQFEYKIQIDNNVDTDMVFIPPLILQPYIENAIWHGLLHKESPGELSLNISQSNGMMVYEIEDNGIGRKKAAKIKTKTALKKKSLGMQITKERLNVAKSKANVDVVDLLNGTKVIIKIPLQ